jgi:hypothetical protein
MARIPFSEAPTDNYPNNRQVPSTGTPCQLSPAPLRVFYLDQPQHSATPQAFNSSCVFFFESSAYVSNSSHQPIDAGRQLC